MPHWTECTTENVFTWASPETGGELTWAVDRILPWAVENALQVFDTPVMREGALMFIRDRGIERHRIERLTQECFNTPVIYCAMDGGKTHLLVDGSHRYVYAALTGRKWIPGYILPQEQWEPFLVTGIPVIGSDRLKTMPSGIE